MDGGVGPLAAPPSGWTGGSGTQLPGDLPKALAGGGSRVSETGGNSRTPRASLIEAPLTILGSVRSSGVP